MECHFCGKKGNHFLCSGCLNSVNYPDDRRCLHCGYPLSSEDSVCMICRNRELFFDQHLSLYRYRDRIRFLILIWKFKNDTQLRDYFGSRMAGIITEGHKDKSIIIPVPGNPVNNKKRGYDPVSLLAKRVSLKAGVPRLEILKRDKGSSQKNCSSEERQSNLVGRIKILDTKNAKSLYQKNIWLLDDIYTTGSTINECSRILRSYRPERIHCITLAQD